MNKSWARVMLTVNAERVCWGERNATQAIRGSDRTCAQPFPKCQASILAVTGPRPSSSSKRISLKNFILSVMTHEGYYFLLSFYSGLSLKKSFVNFCIFLKTHKAKTFKYCKVLRPFIFHYKTSRVSFHVLIFSWFSQLCKLLSQMFSFVF
jgi:hypothetical protein